MRNAMLELILQLHGWMDRQPQDKVKSLQHMKKQYKKQVFVKKFMWEFEQKEATKIIIKT